TKFGQTRRALSVINHNLVQVICIQIKQIRTPQVTNAFTNLLYQKSRHDELNPCSFPLETNSAAHFLYIDTIAIGRGQFSDGFEGPLFFIVGVLCVVVPNTCACTVSKSNKVLQCDAFTEDDWKL
ncbi:hypothetical protein S83_046664, partial [Arachis hypogaea]